MWRFLTTIKLTCVVFVAFLLALPSAVRANVTEENFRLDTTRDLIALCGVDTNDPNATAAIHMCHGYVTGLVHFHIMMGRALEGRIYCMDDQKRPTRDQAIAMLVEWSRAHPEHDSMEAIDGVLQWAADTYPCSE
jgi:hypothetical protein